MSRLYVAVRSSEPNSKGSRIVYTMRFGLYAGVRSTNHLVSLRSQSLGVLRPRRRSRCPSLPRATQLLLQQCLHCPEQCMSLHPHQPCPPLHLLGHAWLTESLLRSPSSRRDRAAMGKSVVCVSYLYPTRSSGHHICTPNAGFRLVPWHSSADTDTCSLTETALAMTIFRDEGKPPVRPVW